MDRVTGNTNDDKSTRGNGGEAAAVDELACKLAVIPGWSLSLSADLRRQLGKPANQRRPMKSVPLSKGSRKWLIDGINALLLLFHRILVELIFMS